MNKIFENTEENEGLLIIISGPSGAGKGTVYNEVLRRRPGIKKSVSVTTRAPRPNEVEGVHYYFRTLEQYQRMIAQGEFLETASVYCNYYGTPKAPVLEMLAHGDDVMFEIDTLGAEQIRRKYPRSITIFARSELAKYRLFDYMVFNDEVEHAVNSVLAIIDAEKSKTHRNMHTICRLLNQEK